MSMPTDVLSPKDAFVKGFSVLDGSNVNANDTICSLSDDEESIALERLQAALSLMQVDAKLLSPDQLQLQQQVTQIALDITQEYVTFAQAKLAFEQKAVADGTGDPIRVAQATAALQKAQGEQNKAGLALRTFNFNVAQAQAKQAISIDQLNSEIVFMTAMKSRLTLKAPVGGTVKLLARTGAFVTKGAPVAQIV